MTLLEQTDEDWKEEKEIEEMKRQITENRSRQRWFHQPQLDRSQASISDIAEDQQTEGFIFENNLGVEMEVTLENYYNWGEYNINITKRKQFKKEAVIDFTKIENKEDEYFRTRKELLRIVNFVRKQESKSLDLNVNFTEDPLIKVDIRIENMRPIKGVPIEVAGRKSYELKLEGETEKQAKNRKYQFVIIVDVSYI